MRTAITAETTHGYVRPKNEREWRFCAIFVREAVARVKNRHLSEKAIREAAAVAVRGAGYPQRRERAVATEAEVLLSLPRIQQGIADTMAAAGVDVAKIATVFAEILDAPIGETVTASDKLKTAELFFKTTTGFAPTKNANMNTNVTVDSMFNPDEYATAPPIKTVSK